MKLLEASEFRGYLDYLFEKHIPVYFVDYEYLTKILDVICSKQEMSKRELLMLAYSIGATAEEANEMLTLKGINPIYEKNREDAIWKFALKMRMDLSAVVEKIFPQNVDEMER